MASPSATGLEAFVAWLSEIEGVDLSSIEFQHTHEQGNYATAPADLAAGSAAVELPAHMLLSYTAATAGVSARHHDPAVLRALRSLEREMRTADDTIAVMTQRMWTSALQLNGREFCSILNFAIRRDHEGESGSLASIVRGINVHCVTVPPEPPFPPDDVCMRGGGFSDRYRPFFVEGKKFRQPAYLATSFSEQVARQFLNDALKGPCVRLRNGHGVSCSTK